MSDYGQRHRPPTERGATEAQGDDPKMVGGGVEADRQWARQRIASYFAARRDPAFARPVAYERPIVQRKTTDTGEWRARLRGAADGAPIAAKRGQAPAAGGRGAIPQSGGSPLPSDVRAKMEPHFGADLSGVKIHSGGDSHEAAANLGARALTVGEDIHFGSGEYAPGTKEGEKLLAHELTHVVQGQKSGIQRKADSTESGGATDETKVSSPDDPAEKEADQVAEQITGERQGEEQTATSQPGDMESAAPVARKAIAANPLHAIREAPSGIALGRKSGKEKADDIPSWAQGCQMLPGETPVQAADRVMRQRFPNGDYPRGPGSEFNKIKKYFERK